jgi:hypothetical protein
MHKELILNSILTNSCGDKGQKSGRNRLVRKIIMN